jgi:hypothetical protein
MANLTDTKIYGNLQVSRDITITGGITNDSLSSSTVLMTDASKKIVSSAVTSTELGYLDGVTSSIQTQLNGKQPTGNYLTTATTFGGDVSGTYNNIAVANDSHTHSTYLPLTGGTLSGNSSSFMGLSIENAGSGWSWINMKAGGTGSTGISAFHVALNNTAVDGALANSLHLRPGGTSTALSINSTEVKSHVKLRVFGDILLDGDATTVNQGREIRFTAFDKEGTTDPSDFASIKHTVNEGGHTGSVLLISSQNDSTDGIAFSTNASSQLKHNGYTIFDTGNAAAGNGLNISATTYSLGTPSTLSASTTNSTTATSHTHVITTTEAGAASTIVKTDSSGGVSGASLGVENSNAATGKGLSLYGGPTTGAPTYGMMFAGTGTFGTHGSVTSDWATYLTMSDTTNRGWIFKRGTTNVASISGTGIIYGSQVYGAVWNDIADFLDLDEEIDIEYGKVYTRRNGKINTTEKINQDSIGIASDTFGFGVGKKENKPQLPVAIGGWVLAYTDKVYKFGTRLVPSRNGILTKAPWYIPIIKPSAIIATFDREEKEDFWNGKEVKGRHWVKVR